MPQKWKNKTREQKDKFNRWQREYNKTHPKTRAQKDRANERDRGYRKTNPTTIATTIARKNKIKEWYVNYKKTLVCKTCGFNNHRALQFHHRDPKTKVHTITIMVRNFCTIETIQKEMQKCDVLCANCHSITHAMERESS